MPHRRLLATLSLPRSVAVTPRPVTPRTVVVTGLSGAGRTTAAKVLEDASYFVVDNLPLGLIGRFVELTESESAGDRMALVLDSRTMRGTDRTEEFVRAVQVLRARRSDTRIIFLEASNEALVGRYGKERRSHPLASVSTLVAAMARERELLADIRGNADIVIDTTDLTPHQLRRHLTDLLLSETTGLTLNIVTFGFKNGTPRDADVIFDVRFLPNPHWQEQLRPMTGLDTAVVDYVAAQPDTAEFLTRLFPLVDLLIDGHERQGRRHLTIAVGCTGGRHRSVSVGRILRDRWAERGVTVRLEHRDVNMTP